MLIQKKWLWLILGCAAWTLSAAQSWPAWGDDSPRQSDDALVLVVMDPLSAKLACECIPGYAQRDYDRLGAYLASALKRPVRVVYGGAIDVAAKDLQGRADIIVGKHSVVEYDAEKLHLKIQPLAALTGLDGKTTQTGWIVVRRDDPAHTVAELKDYRIFFGPVYCEEKSAAPMKLLRAHGISVPALEEVETCGTCGEAAAKLLELDPDVRAAAVISSYVQPLLEGCGNIQKGDLRLVGESEPVPFITAFANQQLPASLISEIRAALLKVKTDPALCLALESIVGFVESDFSTTESVDSVPAAKKK